MLSKTKVKTWISKVSSKFKKTSKTKGLHVPYQYTQQRTITNPTPSKPVLELQPKRKIRYVILKGFSGMLIVLNGLLGFTSFLTNPTLALFFLVNSWLLVYSYKSMGRKT